MLESDNERTLKDPWLLSSSSRMYPSTRAVGCGAQARVTVLFSALHSSGMKLGAPGAARKNSYIRK